MNINYMNGCKGPLGLGNQRKGSLEPIGERFKCLPTSKVVNS